ncbi:MarR family transcriptional regulator [Paenibacillus sp. JX-17]|uniref:MarR family transcriptional regulator n=1 Tax=Paenibacillus lacisoli TaxID=3064525 RepID=A0ABT9C6U2_9BACL|nr:MarR family transcriptional regulator [Paenibacillus sp. JX-17]MDO7904987.1 MarR family transcriptional regulator [Paenibacillus sp. JX-17]
MQTIEFAKLWSKLTKDYKTYMEEHLAPGLTESQLVVLEVLYEAGRMKPSQLIPILETTPAAVTMLLDRMEKNGLISRVRHLDDRRMIWIYLTERGKEEAKRGVQIRNSFMSDVLDRISQHNQNLLVFLLNKITS